MVICRALANEEEEKEKEKERKIKSKNLRQNPNKINGNRHTKTIINKVSRMHMYTQRHTYVQEEGQVIYFAQFHRD